MVLKPVGDRGFDPARALAAEMGSTGAGGGSDTAKFRFPSLDPETERFLWRRKSDLDIIIRSLDKLGLYYITFLTSFLPVSFK